MLWKDWPDSCLECGSDMEIQTDATEDGKCFDGDPVRCVECSFTSIIAVHEDGTCEIQST